MNAADEDKVAETKDLSRPYFPRKAGELGLYLDVYDCAPEDPHAYGSEQLMRIDVNDKLGDHLAQRDLVKVKGELEKRGHFRGAILEDFRRGTVLPVLFDSPASLKEVWALHQGKQLSPLFHGLLVDKSMLKALGVRKMALRVRAWEDELQACLEETRRLSSPEAKRVNINSRPRDLGLLQRVRQFQKQPAWSGKLQELHDAEAEFDRHLSEFMLAVKQALPQKVDRLSSLKEFTTNMTMAMGTHAPRMQHVKHYLATLELLRTMLAQAEAGLWLPLTLIPARCESERQREVKRQMKATCVEMSRLLRPTSSLREIGHKEWEGKILPRERQLFLALISLVPLGVEKVTDVDQFVDEYITGFPPS